jgi:hypothetical protein
VKRRFSIRDLLWITALCAVLVSWWLDRAKLNARLEALETPKEILIGGKPWDYRPEATP